MNLPSNHLSRIANFFTFKLRELRFHLENIVELSDASLVSFKAGEEIVKGSGAKLIYSFSAYTNTIQSIKDNSAVFLPTSLTWSKIGELRHGKFLKEVRNAITHDGNPVISGWADGLYFVPNRIARLVEGKIVLIDPPEDDIRKLCLEFSLDFANLLSDVLKQVPQDPGLSMSIFDINELDEMYANSKFIPEFAKKMHLEQREATAKAIREMKVAHIENAITEADELAEYCKLELAKQ